MKDQALFKWHNRAGRTASTNGVTRPSKLLVLMTTTALAVLSCGADSQSPLDATLTEKTYTNNYFGFTLPLPEGWTVASVETQEYLTEIGEETLAGDDAMLRASVKAALKKTFQLLLISEHPVGAPVEFNPSIILMAENVSHVPGIRNGADYLFHLSKILERSSVPYEARGAVSEIELSGRTFHRQDFEVVAQGGVWQSYIFARDDGYMLGFVLTSGGPSGLDGLLTIANQIAFD